MSGLHQVLDCTTVELIIQITEITPCVHICITGNAPGLINYKTKYWDQLLSARWD